MGLRMNSATDASASIDYIEFQIVPTQNRFEAWVCYGTKKDKVSSGPLEHLLLHSDDIKSLYLKGSNAKYKLCVPENSDDIKWCKTSTLIRFLNIIGSEDILGVSDSLKNEISQLEEAQKFHLSLYTKDSKYTIQSAQSDGVSCSEGRDSTTHAEGSDSSKNELMRAMDLRLTALRQELASAFDQASCSQYSLDEMTEIQKLSRLFGAKALSDSLRKYIEFRRAPRLSSEHFTEGDEVGPEESNDYANRSSSENPTKYSASPAKATQTEMRNTTETEDESSLSSDREQGTSVERSRDLVRSASPRRSASPMRRVQIGRLGARRPTALTIKSLDHFTTRERSRFPRDDDHSGEEESKQVPQKPETNPVRMSVQDAINLFESKQRDQRGDVQKAKTIANVNKSVLRRWSSGMGEVSSSCRQDSSSLEGTEVPNTVKNNEATSSSPNYEADNLVEAREADKQEELRPIEAQTEVHEKSNTSAEWNRQKEAELNQLFVKMMETKPGKNWAETKRRSLPSERGGFCNGYKEKRDGKLAEHQHHTSTSTKSFSPKQIKFTEQAGKKITEKNKSRSNQQTLDAKKSKWTPSNTNDENRKCNVKKLQNPVKSSLLQHANSKIEKSPRPGIVKKDSLKASSSLPAIRKSWPTSPSARATDLPRAKTPPALSTDPTATRRKPQPTPLPAVSQSRSGVETSQTRRKPIKSNQNDSKKCLKTDLEKKEQSLTKLRKPAKSKVVETTVPKDIAPLTKPSLYNKMTKKSSVVPLESKSFLRKGSKTTISGSNVVSVKKASHSQEQSRKSNDRSLPEESEPSLKFSDLATHEEKKIEEPKVVTSMMEPISIPQGSPARQGEGEGLTLTSPTTDFAVHRLVEPGPKFEAEEELTISPRAWVEIEEIDHDSERAVDSHVDINPTEVPSPRIRHSLSQMLLEESTEPDFVDWGNADNAPAMVYQKDVPKGLKRLLKFARKSKHEANATGWSNPSVISEEEDDADDTRLTSKRSAENLLKKATLQSSNNCQQNNYSDYEQPSQANISKLIDQSLDQDFQHGHVSASVVTTKATRSFFSLSAFKSSK